MEKKKEKYGSYKTLPLHLPPPSRCSNDDKLRLLVTVSTTKGIQICLYEIRIGRPLAHTSGWDQSSH